MPVSRVRPHIAASHSGLTPQMVGDPLRSKSSSTPYSANRVQKYAQVVKAKQAALATDAADATITTASVGEEDAANDETETQTQLVGINALFGSWWNDVEHIELKHMMIFNADNTGSLKSQGNVDGIGARLLNFQYTLAEDRSSLEIRYLPLSPLITNPFEISKYIPEDQIPETTVTLPFKVFENVIGDEDTYSFLAPSGKIYEPTLALQFEQSPWPMQMFPTRTRYYGALRRVRANKVMLK